MQAYELLEMRKHHCMGFVPTSLLKLDKALQGGLHCGTVTEVTLSGVGVAGMSRGSTSAHAHTHTHTHTYTHHVARLQDRRAVERPSFV